jgi:hypothetical protein
MTVSNPVVIVGSASIAEDAAPLLRALAAEFRVGMLNTYAVKGLFAWNDPAHLGTIGLQAGDLELAGVECADVVLVGVPEAEIARSWLESVGANWRDVTAADLAQILVLNAEPTPRPILYDALAQVCGPLYTADSLPMNPARAASDLAGWLPTDGVVHAGRDMAGFWLGRTFPTRQLGSVRFGGWSDDPPATVAIVWGDHHAAALAAAGAVVECWTPTGPTLAPLDRLDRLSALVAAGTGAVVELGVDASALDALVAVAGAVLWG